MKRFYLLPLMLSAGVMLSGCVNTSEEIETPTVDSRFYENILDDDRDYYRIEKVACFIHNNVEECKSDAKYYYSNSVSESNNNYKLLYKIEHLKNEYAACMLNDYTSCIGAASYGESISRYAEDKRAIYIHDLYIPSLHYLILSSLKKGCDLENTNKNYYSFCSRLGMSYLNHSSSYVKSSYMNRDKGIEYLKKACSYSDFGCAMAGYATYELKDPEGYKLAKEFITKGLRSSDLQEGQREELKKYLNKIKTL
ncbi:hypothetical protein [Succinivibrio dextrinosolvens]|jgi:hypothetical protein|uniref:hypothetical protein n=1 Tax=Succinivibrio dextrinosolvens TaxID=83771 RepID=UPI00241E4A6A|nr:hypothetical protein [Succinivibrio dextrinosolvens]MBE6423129.1 hypothetical protein [Succinivibrio dextrinosolvens]